MPNGTNSFPPGPAYGGDGGGKSCVVHAHNRPRRARRCSAISIDEQRGHDSWLGKVTIPHAAHWLPISCGSSAGHVKMPSARGRRVISADDNAILAREKQSRWLTNGHRCRTTIFPTRRR